MLKTLGSRLVASYLLVIVLALILASLALLVQGIQYGREDAYARMTSSLYLIIPQARNQINSNSNQQTLAAKIRETIAPQLQNTNFRLLILSPSGTVLTDTRTTKANTINQINLDAAQQIAGRSLVQGTAIDVSGNRWLYVAAPPRELLRPGSTAGEGQLRGLVYVALAQRNPAIGEAWADLRRPLPLAAALGLVVALLLGGILARSITRPLANLTHASRQMAAGNYNQQVPVEGSSEMADLAHHFNVMAAEVEKSRQVQHDFLANVSHDLKTPLTSIGGFSQAMIDGTIRDPAGFKMAAQTINDEAQRMNRLVSDLVDLTRIRSGEARIELRPTDIGALLRETAAAMQPQATERHVELRVEAGPTPVVQADPDRMRRAVSNLIDNALHHTPTAGRVIVRSEVAPGGVVISVRDSGYGIPAEDLPRIFERFYQVDKSRAAKGGNSGLGLAIVHEIVLAHNGHIGVQSQVGLGTEFRITLPLPGAATSTLPITSHRKRDEERTQQSA